MHIFINILYIGKIRVIESNMRYDDNLIHKITVYPFQSAHHTLYS